jgi:hypothetical protein
MALFKRIEHFRGFKGKSASTPQQHQADVKPNNAPGSNLFNNDGSFLEHFKKMRETKTETENVAVKDGKEA